MVYEKINEFIRIAGISRSKLYRFYKKNDELWQETKIKSNKRLIPTLHAKYFDTEILYDELQTMMLENRSLKRLIDCLFEKDSLVRTLWEMEWSFFFTVAYKAERNKKSCFRLMNALFDELQDKYGDSTEIKMFFTTEPFTNRKGYHNHFVIYVSDNNGRGMGLSISREVLEAEGFGIELTTPREGSTVTFKLYQSKSVDNE